MHLRVLMDNIEWNGMIGEWGLSLLIDYAGHSILLDAGATGRFVENARAMGVNLKDVEVCVLSHGHYDHADGFERFFEENDRAKVALQRAATQRYYGKKWIFHRYIGVDRDMLRDSANRFQFVGGAQELRSENGETYCARGGAFTVHLCGMRGVTLFRKNGTNEVMQQ